MIIKYEPNLKLDLFPIELNRAYLEVNTNGRNKRSIILILGESKKYACLADARVADEQQFK